MNRLNLVFRPAVSLLFVACFSPALTFPAEGVQVTGEVRALHGKAPMAGVRALLTPDDDPAGVWWPLMRNYLRTYEPARETLQSVTGPDGAFSFSNIPPGAYRLSAEGPGIGLSQAYEMEISREGDSLGPFLLHTIPGGGIRGRIYDRATGTGLSGKEIGIGAYSPGASKKYQGETDPEGYYAFENIPPGFCSIALYWKPNAAPFWKTNNENDTGRRVSLRNGQHVTRLDFPLEVPVPRPGTINGMVVDPSGAPVSGAVISTERFLLPSGNIETDASGRFTLTDLNPDAEVEIHVYKEGFAGPPVKARPNAGDAVTIVVRSEAVVSGTVRDEEGLAVQGAQVYVKQVNGPVLRIGMTKGDGTFRVGSLPPGDYSLHTNFQPDNSTFSSHSPRPYSPDDGNAVGAYILTEGQILSGIEAPLRQNGYDWSRITGRVINTEEKPVAGVRVRADDNRHAGSAVTDSDGNFNIARLPRGAYRLELAAKGYSQIYGKVGDEGFPYKDRRDLIKTGDAPVTLVLRKSGRVEGRVVHAETGAPIPVFEIGLAHRPAEWPRMNMNYDIGKSCLEPDGRFSLELYLPFKYVVVRAEGFAHNSVPIKAEPGKDLRELVVSMKPAQVVEGRTLDAEGAPLPFAQIFAPLDDEILGDDEGTNDIATLITSDAEGRFVIDHFSPGLYRLGVYAPGFQRGYQRFKVKSGGKTHVELHVRHGGAKKE
ncbi:MAG: carboxypeptidase regulatory-like domain-containing protein [Candidatus Hydrogenedens sp.]|nr:carboxypeptidase regulatory-like domain-containing protein [Candidatus Hydrogenedens sp.]